ncbi:MAG: hypothetical protein ACTSPB_02350 [Candidatus Thorarchaeota archaeon]
MINLKRANLGLCVVCGEPKRPEALTCYKEDCHEKFVAWCEEKFGIYKKITGLDGITRRVPTRDIIEKGLRSENLSNYPEWS